MNEPITFWQDKFSLDEGSVILQWPTKMSVDSYNDFEAWIELELRKIKRITQV